MRNLLLVALVAACASDSTELAIEEQALIGCWEGQLYGGKVEQFRFHDDRTVDNRIVDGTWYTGNFTVDGDQLTLDFGEEPPTYRIQSVTTTQLELDSRAGTYTRITCP